MSRILAIDTALNCCSAAIYNRDDSGKRSLSYSAVNMMTGHSEKLMPLIDGLLNGDHGDPYKNLTAICVTVGPGAFTGIRIGLSTARALGLALNLPVIGITTFDVLTRQYAYEEIGDSLNLQMTSDVDGKKIFTLPIGLVDAAHPGMLENYKDVAIIIDTKRTDFYTRIDGNDSIMTTQQIMDALSGRKITLLGDGIKRLYSEITSDAKYSERLFWRIKLHDKYQRFVWRGDIDCPHPGVLASIGLKMLDEGIVDLHPPEPVYLRGADVSQSKRKNRTIAAE